MPCVIQASVRDTYTSGTFFQPLLLGSGFFLV